MIKGYIFDVDGTILDSMGAWKGVAADYLEKLGITVEEGLDEKVFSMSLFDSADYMRKTYKLPYTQEELIAGIVDIIRNKYFHTIPLKEGVKTYLEYAKNKGMKLIAATTSEKELVEGAFQRLGIREYFKDILTCRDVGAGKDKPDIYYEAARMLDLKPEQCQVYEDALYAATTAHKAGFSVIGIFDEESKDSEENLRKICVQYVHNLMELV